VDTHVTPDLQPCFELLDEAVAKHDPALIYALFSGGHDSLTAVTIAQDWATQHRRWLPVAHVNTGTGIPETREFVINTAQAHSWPLLELHPPRSYRSLVLELGFPGPGYHDRLAYPRLKERCFRNLARTAPADRHVLFITGVRSQESERRTEHVERIQVGPKIVWAAPIWDWTKTDCNHFIADRGLQRNRVVDLLHISGECLCGAMARPLELQEIAEWFPEKAAEIRQLEDEAERRGLRACRWGVRPPKVAREQMRAFLTPNDGSFPMLCAGCGPDE
jgi:3'-phosphoadenosine 5'-phosphosulfate sulfotransferase (PAPS reductase)/FAD synthetase